MTDLFEPQTIESQANLTARHLPVGRVWDRAFESESNIYRLMLGLSYEFFRLELLSKILDNEINIRQTLDLISTWERSVGIPDCCFCIDETDEVRREQILQKFSNLGGVQTAEDFERVAALFGYDVTVKPAVELAGIPLPVPFEVYSDTKSVKHTIVVETTEELSQAQQIPYTVPFVLEDRIPFFLECIFERLAPANVDVIFKIVKPSPDVGSKLLIEDGGDDLYLLETGDFILLEDT